MAALRIWTSAVSAILCAKRGEACRETSRCQRRTAPAICRTTATWATTWDSAAVVAAVAAAARSLIATTSVGTSCAMCASAASGVAIVTRPLSSRSTWRVAMTTRSVTTFRTPAAVAPAADSSTARRMKRRSTDARASCPAGCSRPSRSASGSTRRRCRYCRARCRSARTSWRASASAACAASSDTSRRRSRPTSYRK